MAGHVDRGYGQRVRRDIHSVHDNLGERSRNGDCDAATPGTQINGFLGCARCQPRREAHVNQLGKRRARHQYALVYIKFESGEPGLIDEIGNGHTLFNTFVRKEFEARKLLIVDFSLVARRRIVMRQTQVREYEPCRLVNRVVSAMPVAQLRRRKAISIAVNQLLDVDGLLGFLCHI